LNGVRSSPCRFCRESVRNSELSPHGEVPVVADELIVLAGVVVVMVAVVEFVTVRVGAVIEMPIEVDRVSVIWAVVVFVEPPACVNA
jgi:hypothetical protein